MLKPAEIMMFAVISLVCLLPPVAAEDWGILQGRFVFDGQIPDVEPLQIARDEEICGPHGLVDESLVVNEDNNGIRNVVIWLSSRKDVPIHPSLQEVSKPAKLDNRNCRFEPRVVRLRTNQPLQSINSDAVAHNVAVYARRNQPFSIIVPQDEPMERTFSRSELIPVRVDCSIHAWMRAYLVITDHPYSAVSDKDGNFAIKHVPQGEWDFRIWHERPGYVKTLHGKIIQELKRGTLKLNVQSKTDLGDLKIKAAEFTEDSQP